MRINLDHVASGRFVLGRDVHCEFDYFAIGSKYASNKGMLAV